MGDSRNRERMEAAVRDTLAKAAAGIKNVDVVIPGHAPVTNWQALVDYGEFIKSFVDSVKASAAAGRTPDQAAAAFAPAAKFSTYNLQRAKADVDIIYKELGK